MKERERERERFSVSLFSTDIFEAQFLPKITFPPHIHPFSYLWVYNIPDMESLPEITFLVVDDDEKLPSRDCPFEVSFSTGVCV